MIDNNLITNYRAAYEAANDKTAPTVTYRNGWYVVGNPSYKYSPKYRAKVLMEMTERLKLQATATADRFLSAQG